jgi:DNA-binding response OmpR family regulator
MNMLLVEDDEDHAALFMLAFPERQVRHVADAESAIAVLSDENAPVPDLVMLDLKLRGHGGLMVLEWIRKSPRHGRIPVAVLSTSRAVSDRIAAAEAGSDAYYEKPIGGDDYESLRERIDAWWPEWVSRSA